MVETKGDDECERERAAGGGSLPYFTKPCEYKYKVHFRVASYKLQRPKVVTELRLCIELHGINYLGCFQNDHIREVSKVTYHRVW